MAIQTQRIADAFTLTGQKLKAINLKLSGLADGSLAGLLTTDKSSLVAANNELYELIQDLTASAGAIIDDNSVAADRVLSAAKIYQELLASQAAAVAQAKSELLNGAGTAYDTLKELQDLFVASDSAVAAINTALSNRVRVDAVQAFTEPQKLQARSNIGAQSAAEIGDTDTNYVTVLNAAMA